MVRRKEEGDCNLLIFSWIDREGRYFTCSGSNMLDGEPNIRTRFRQDSDEINAEPESLTLVVNQPYNICCVMVNHHNLSRNTDLKLEKKLVTKD